MTEVLDIYSHGDYPSCALSNFAEHDFMIDGVLCRSMEGFLQSLKYRNPKRQREICLMTGRKAKEAGEHKFLWRWTGNIRWQGQKLSRCGKAYQRLLDRAYDALFENVDFRKALGASIGKRLTHEIGKEDPQKTILTVQEYIARLEALRARL